MTNRSLGSRGGVAALLLVLSVTCGWAQEVAAPSEPAAATEQPAPAETPPPAPPAPATSNVLIHTELGDILVALEIERAPLTTKNFLHYVDTRRFDNITFYRGVKLTDDGKYGLVQGGLQGNPKLIFKPVAHEAPKATGVSHVDGAISMARMAPGSATADFFIVVGDLQSMDGTATEGEDVGYAAFGHVVSGMDVVHAILERPKTDTALNPVMKGQMLAQPVKILTVRRSP